MYHIFQVDDYKGGEQSYSLNLTKEQVTRALIEAFCPDDIELETEATIDNITAAIHTIIENEAGLYAGGDSIVLAIFETTTDSDKLIEISIEDFIPFMAKLVLEKGRYEVTNVD